jgi:O-antigen/teichoic acid export membrane protein
MNTLTLLVVAAATVLCIIAGVAIFPLLSLVGNPIYQEHLSAYWVMLAVVLVAALAEVPHSGLYAKERDREIVVSTLGGLVVALALNLLLVPPHGPTGAALATLVASAVLGGAKAWYLRTAR